MTFEPHKLQGKIPLCAPNEGDSTEETAMPAQLTVSGSFWPPNSLLNKFIRLCH